MSHVFTIEAVTVIERGTDMENEILCHVKFKEVSFPVAFQANRKPQYSAQQQELWTRINNGEFGEIKWPPASYQTLPKPQAELEVIERAKRDELLAKSDFSQMADAGLSDSQKALWATYRTALRNVPTQPGFPYEINWPTKP
jgi:hypothetical protein